MQISFDFALYVCQLNVDIRATYAAMSLVRHDPSRVAMQIADLWS